MTPEENLASAFMACVDAPLGTGWNDRERISAQHLTADRVTSGDQLYLGGDLLQPYLSWVRDDHLFIASLLPRRRSARPRLLAELASGAFGLTRVSPTTLSGNLETYRVALSDELRTRLSMPRVTLTTLTNTSRYRAIRFPLNVARLAQWLRFSHSARVTALDASLDANGDISILAQDIIATDSDLLGVSLNFGELARLEQLLSILREARFHPLICVGNVLAAWAPDQVREVCEGFEIVLSATYGEGLVEAVCDKWDSEQARFAIGADLRDPETPPHALLFPDESLVARTLQVGGQLSIETSFGCQYGACSFCPRDHRGRGWWRPAVSEVCSIIDRLGEFASVSRAPASRVLSLVDEDAFGQEGIDETVASPSLLAILDAAQAQGLRCEVYTRLEQIFDRRKSHAWNTRRLEALHARRPSLSRVFVGVESGSGSQLVRYGKGQTVEQIVDALRAGSLLGLPFEFGFITFDPLLTQDELVESIAFLGRDDVVLDPVSHFAPGEILAYVLDNEEPHELPGRPLFERVAYLATELELLVSSRYASRLRRDHPELVGEFDPNFSRYYFHYQDEAVEEISNWCRVWTEGTFESVYRIRLAIRSSSEPQQWMVDLVRRFRTATYHILLALVIAYLPDKREQPLRLAATVEGGQLSAVIGERVDVDALSRVWEWTLSVPGAETLTNLLADFDVNMRHRRRVS